MWAVPLTALGFPVTHPGIPAVKGCSGRGTVCKVGPQWSLMGCDSSSRACGCRLPSQGRTGLREILRCPSRSAPSLAWLSKHQGPCHSTNKVSLSHGSCSDTRLLSGSPLSPLR